MTNDPMSCVPVLRPCPVLSAGSDDLPQASYRGQWRKWDTAGRGAGEQAKKTQASAASQVGQPLLGRPVPQPLRQVGGGCGAQGSTTGIGPWPLRAKPAASQKEEQCLKSRRLKEKLLGPPANRANAPSSLASEKTLTDHRSRRILYVPLKSLAPHTQGQAQSGPKNSVLRSWGRRPRDHVSQEGLGAGTEPFTQGRSPVSSWFPSSIRAGWTTVTTKRTAQGSDVEIR